MRALSTLAILAVVSVSEFQIHGQEKKADKVGYEILQIKSLNEIVAWASGEITREEFDSLELPWGWFKNQPREIEVDGGKFLTSPGCEEGRFKRAEHFGHQWLHVATVKTNGIRRLDSKRRLVASTVVKEHVVAFDQGRTLTLLVSPKGKVFPRISRDANRNCERPTIPENWRLIEHKLTRPVKFRLSGETTVIRADNQDSFQGPVEFSFDQPRSSENKPNSSAKRISKLYSGGPSYGLRNDKQWARMRSLSHKDDREFLMVNLTKYRAKAKYFDGRKTDLTGKQANGLYAPIKFIAQIGGRIHSVGRVKDQMGNLKPRWDEIGIVHYPSRAKFFEMVTNPEFQKRAIHKDVGLEISQVLLTEPVPWTLPESKRVSDQADAINLVELLKYREIAKYKGDNGPKQNRPGRQAMDAFDAAVEDALNEVGAKRLLRTKVEDALIGDGRKWDEFRVLHFPSEAAYKRYTDAVQEMQKSLRHRQAAIEDSYVMKVEMMPLAQRLAVSLATSVFGRQARQRDKAANKDQEGN